MKLTIQEAQIAELKPSLPEPALGFVREAIAGGKGYKVGSGGYFVVAGMNSILPRFVVDLRLPELPNLASYKWVAIQMLKRSNGMLFVGSSHSDAFALAWRLQLQVLPGSPLFQFAPQAQKHSSSSEAMREAGAHDEAHLKSLLTSVPRHLGGASEHDVTRYVQNKQAHVLERGGKLAAAAVLVPQGDRYLWLEAFALDPSARHRESGYKVFEKLGLEARRSGRTLIFGMSHQGAAEYAGALKLGITMVGQSWHAFLPTACSDFRMTPSYS
ncbi:MAG TPA: hypothetical protein VEV17_01765 [Bryobacteraceae bacterium]|nr:hypothetical protein [Bryobacteraceae bacterium]